MEVVEVEVVVQVEVEEEERVVLGWGERSIYCPHPEMMNF